MNKIIVGGTYSDFACEEFERIFKKDNTLLEKESDFSKFGGFNVPNEFDYEDSDRLG